MPAHRRGAPRPERRCHICDKTFGKTEHLERHIRSHTRDKPFTCNVCDKSFSRNDTLLRHWRSHGAEGPAPNASASQARRPATQLQPQQMNQTQQSHQAAQQAQQASSSQLDPSLANGYPQMGLGGYGQNFPDRHTEAASVLLSLPQGGSSETHPNQPESGLHFPAAGNETSADLLQDYAEGALDPMLAMSEPHGQTNTEHHHENQFHHHSADGQLPHQFKDQYQSLFDFDRSAMDLDSPVESTFTVKLPEDFDLDTFYRSLDNMFPELSSHSANGVTKSEEAATVSALDLIPWIHTPERKIPDPRVHTQLVPKGRWSWKECIERYFKHFNTVFPIVHAPSFNPSAENPILTAVIVSIGSLFTTEYGYTQYIDSFPKLSKFLEQRCVEHRSNKEAYPLVLVQACLIAEVFRMVSGLIDSPSMFGSGGYESTWIQELITHDKHDNQPTTYQRQQRPSQTDLQRLWQEWGHKEERRRVLHGIFIVGYELANFMESPESAKDLSNDTKHLPVIAPDEFFHARTADEWYDMLSNNILAQVGEGPVSVEDIVTANMEIANRFPRFTAYATLERLSGEIALARDQNELSSKFTLFQQSLMDFYNKHCSSTYTRDNDLFNLTMLWHATWIDLLVNSHMFEGCFGTPKHPFMNAKQELNTWASSPNVLRAVAHAVMIERHASRLRDWADVSIHVPRTLYVAALVIYAYGQFKPVQGRQEDITAYPELQMLATIMARSPDALVPLAQYGAEHSRQVTTRLVRFLDTTPFPLGGRLAGPMKALLSLEDLEPVWSIKSEN